MITVTAVKKWLSRHSKWLLILDNADELAIVNEFIPSALQGHLLLTTRTQVTGELARKIDVEAMKPEIGALFLLRRARVIAADVSLQQGSATENALAKEIAREMGGLPLALDQAGAYIEETLCSLDDYRKLYQTQRAKLLEERGGVVPDHPESVATTLSLAFQKVEQTNLAAADLLRLCAFLSPDVIPEEIITQGAEHLGPYLSAAASDSHALNRAIQALRAYSLIYRNSATHTLTIHRLVQAVLKDAMDKQMYRHWAEQTVRAVNTVFPIVNYETWSQCERLLLHALACCELTEQFPPLALEAERLLQRTGWYLGERARFAEAQLILERAVISGQLQEKQSLQEARNASTLAWLYQEQGKYVKAEPLLKQAIAIFEQQLGPADHETAKHSCDLAFLYELQGKYSLAEQLMRHTLTIQEQQLGVAHIETAKTLDRLAGFCFRRGKYSEAESLRQRVSAIFERQLGLTHSATIAAQNNLASIYTIQGKYAQAEALYEHGLSIREQQLGPEHPGTINSLDLLARFYYAQGKYAQAEPLLQRVLSLQEKRLGPEHPDVVTSLNNLAELYLAQGKYVQAEPLFQRALRIREQVLGPDHPDVATSLNNLANLYWYQGKYEEAEPLLQRALAIYEEMLGPDYPNVVTSLNNLAELYRAQGKYAQAEPLFQRALHINEQMLGPDHPDVTISLNNLAELYAAQGKYAKAERFYQRIIHQQG